MIILNEVKAAEKCLNNGLIEGKPLYTISILAKYYYHHYGYKKKQIEELLLDYLKKYYPRYEYSEFWWEEKVESVAKKAKEKTLYEIEGISITKSEFEKIKSLNDKVMERILFTALCLAKFCNAKNPLNNNWINFKASDIYKLARVACPVKERFFRLGILGRMGLIECSQKLYSTNFRITFVDDDSEQVLFVTESDFRELGYVYRQYCGEKFIHCAECDILMRPNKNNTRRYCKDCASYEKQDYKFVTCSVCGKEFRTSNVDNRADKCPECQYKEKYNIQGTKIVKCVDCGKEFEVSAKATGINRCPDCQYKRHYDIQGEQTKICIDCGKEFKTTNPNKVRCDDCHYKYNHSIKGEQTKICIDCGKEFVAINSKQVRCNDCQYKYNHSIKGEQTKICIDCGKEFTTNLANKVRCDSCTKEHKKELKRLEMQRYRAKKKNV